MGKQTDSYRSRGVSPTKEDVKAAIREMDKGLFPGAFCSIHQDIAGDPDYCYALHADGAGTKSSLAYIMYKESGQLKWFQGIAQDSLVMNTDDLACIGAVSDFYLSNTIGRNAHLIDGAVIAEIIAAYQNLITRLSALGCSITMTGGETADVGDLVRTLICDSTLSVRLPKKHVIDAGSIKPGLKIVGLASFGRSTYEFTENSGIGSNGLTAARHLLLDRRYAEKYPESYSPTLKPEDVYSGSHDLMEPLAGSSLTVGEAILSPTRTYLPLLRRVLPAYRNGIHGIIHCTGGGQVKCRDFSKGVHYIKDNLFDLPPLFRLIYEEGQMSAEELYQVFNCGHLMELYVDDELTEDLIQEAGAFGIEAKVIGRTESSRDDTNRVTIRSELGEFSY